MTCMCSICPTLDYFAETLSQAKRFSLSIQFLSLVERQTLGQLMEKMWAGLTDRQQDLAEMGVTEWNLQEVRRKYRC